MQKLSYSQSSLFHNVHHKFTQNLLRGCSSYGLLLDKPYALLSSRIPNTFKNNFNPISHTRTFTSLPLKIFDCTSFVYIRDPTHSKLEPRALKCVSFNYSSIKNGIDVIVQKNENILFGWMLHFFENQPFYTKNSLQRENLVEENFQDVMLPSIPLSTPISPNR